ncbi:hypothetical protein BH23ACT4_BH23ACT4_09490 [soil metagenome]
MRKRAALTLVLLSFAASACGRPVAYEVDDGIYGALVPSVEQFAVDSAPSIPGGFGLLRDAGVNQVELALDGDEVTFRLDGRDVLTRSVVDRITVRDREGSGPFKANKELLVLGNDPLVLGGLSIIEPVIWPGSFEGSPVITVKPRDPEERGPDVSCRADEKCLLLSAGADPTGLYEDVNNPELNENPIASIRVSDDFVEFTLDTGQEVRTSRIEQSWTTACGLSETAVWDVPDEIDLAIDDPILLHTVCPSSPGGSIQLIIIERSEIPTLAPLDPKIDGWCSAGPDRLWLAPG